MTNYFMIYGVSETAQLFGVSRDIVKEWSCLFSDYLSSEANPIKGNIRRFTVEDVRVFAYILMYWEDDPDIEYIKIGLNSGSQYEIDVIDNFVTSITPLFRPMPDNIDDTWRGVVFGGEFLLSDLFETANSFKLAGDRLVDFARTKDEQQLLFQPIMYNYRHSLELYMKAIVGGEKKHILSELLSRLSKELKRSFNADIPKWFTDSILAFDHIDPEGTAFRYGITIPIDELYIDVRHVKVLMSWLSESFNKIKEEKKKTY